MKMCQIARRAGLGVVAPLALLILSFVNCSGGDDELGACKSQECSGACQGDSDCSPGTYCGPKQTCVADCTAGAEDCGAGQVCSAEGRCITDPNPATDGGFSLDTGIDPDGGVPPVPPSDACVKVEVNFKPQIPNVVLLIDQSSSMALTFGGGSTRNDALRRWVILRDALMNETTGIVKLMESDVRFGLMLYSSRNGSQNDAECPLLTEVPISIDNYAAISEMYPARTWIDDTPTGESVAAAAARLAAYEGEGPKVIVLATDGEPDSCEDPDAQDQVGPRQDAARQLVVDAVQGAFVDKIQTYVISVGSDVGRDHLRQVANAGQGHPLDDATDRFYLTTNQMQLQNAFDAIITGVRPCIVDLNGEVQRGLEREGKVSVNDQPLVYEDPNGWKLNSPSQIEFLGEACETIKTERDVDIKIDFPCEAIVIR